MTTCMFITLDWPITPMAAGGTPALIYSHLELLAGAVDKIALIILKRDGLSRGFDAFCRSQPDTWNRISSWCREVHTVEINPTQEVPAMTSRVVASLLNPALYSYADLIESYGMVRLEQLVGEISPDFIWCEHLIPATLVQQIGLQCPVIYSHHDWRWKIKAHRSGASAWKVKQALKFWFSKRLEIQLVRRAAACVSGSQTELDEMRAFGARNLVYFPVTYAPVALPDEWPAAERPRIVHLGGMQTTANRLGLQRFLEISWPIISQQSRPVPELWVIGNLEGAPPVLMHALKQPNIVCTGVVLDLGPVLRPADIHVIPWEYDTGTRTRIPLVLNHAQVLVSTRAAAACIPELVHGQNCILVGDLLEMAWAVARLVCDPHEGLSIAEHGRASFLHSFTKHAQQPQFNLFTEQFLRRIDVASSTLAPDGT